MEPTIFEPRLKFQPRLKFLKFGCSPLKICHHTGCVLCFPVLNSDLHSCIRFLCRGVLRNFCGELIFFLSREGTLHHWSPKPLWNHRFYWSCGAISPHSTSWLRLCPRVLCWIKEKNSVVNAILLETSIQLFSWI